MLLVQKIKKINYYVQNRNTTISLAGQWSGIAKVCVSAHT